MAGNRLKSPTMIVAAGHQWTGDEEPRGIAMTGTSGEHHFLDVAKLFGARQVMPEPFTMADVR